MSARPQITSSTSYDDLPELVTLHEAAAWTGMSYYSLHQSCRRGHIPHRRIGPKLIFIPKTYFAPETAKAVSVP